MQAYEYAAEKHFGMVRGTGEPYICHPLRVAKLVTEWGFESDVIIAATLHDVVEDCDTPLSEIRDLFGTNVANIVDVVTALSDKDFADHNLTKAQRDLLSDARLQKKMNDKALYVKIADRIDNLNTLSGVKEAKRIPKAEHTREIIIPMARLANAYHFVDDLASLISKENIALYDLTLIVSDELSEGNSSIHPNDIFFKYFDNALSRKGFYLIKYCFTTYKDTGYFLISDEMDNLYRLFVRTEMEYQRFTYGNIVDADSSLTLADINEIEPRDTYNEKIKVFRRDGSAMLIDNGATVLDFAFISTAILAIILTMPWLMSPRLSSQHIPD